MAYFYVATSQKPTCVNHSIVCHFTSKDERNLILARGNGLEVHTIEESGLVGVLSVALHGKIISLDYFRDGASGEDWIFVLTEFKNFSVFAYDAAERKLVTKAVNSVKDRVGKDAVSGQCACIDPLHRMLGMILAEGQIKVRTARCVL
jgi:DNA damage-binding protein 1